MTRWCPICENPGKPVVRGSLSRSDVKAVESGRAIRVSESLPGIEPSHFCSRCPTFFRGRDRFYLTARRDDGIHGISVWPHRASRVRIESVKDGLVFLFGDRNWIMIDREAFLLVMRDFFWSEQQRELISWSSRRGFEIRVLSNGNGLAEFRVDPAGSQFMLVVTKAWAQDNSIRSVEDGLCALEHVGARPLVYGPSEHH